MNSNKSNTLDQANTAAAVQPDDVLLDVAAVCERLGIGRTLVYEIMDRGELPYFKFGRARRVSVGDLEAFKASCYRGGWAVAPQDVSCPTLQVLTGQGVRNGKSHSVATVSE